GPEAHLEGGQAELFRARALGQYGDRPLVEDRLYLGLVEQAGENARVRVGGKVYNLPVANMAWAARFSKSDATNDKQITAAREALKKGDVVWVKWAFHSRVPRFSDFTYNEEGDAIW